MFLYSYRYGCPPSLFRVLLSVNQNTHKKINIQNETQNYSRKTKITFNVFLPIHFGEFLFYFVSVAIELFLITTHNSRESHFLFINTFYSPRARAVLGQYRTGVFKAHTEDFKFRTENTEGQYILLAYTAPNKPRQ